MSYQPLDLPKLDLYYQKLTALCEVTGVDMMEYLDEWEEQKLVTKEELGYLRGEYLDQYA